MNFIKRSYKSMKHDYRMMMTDRLLKKFGYSNGLIHFPGIDMLLSVPKNHYFMNNGIVKSIEDYTKFLEECFGPGKSCDRDYSRDKGMCFDCNVKIIGGDEIKTSIIYIIDSGNKYENMMIYGHESVHAIRNLGLEDQFLDKLKDEGLSIRPFLEYKNEQAIATLGEMIADYNSKKRFYPNDPLIKLLYNELLKNPEG